MTDCGGTFSIETPTTGGRAEDFAGGSGTGTLSATVVGAEGDVGADTALINILLSTLPFGVRARVDCRYHLVGTA